MLHQPLPSITSEINRPFAIVPVTDTHRLLSDRPHRLVLWLYRARLMQPGGLPALKRAVRDEHNKLRGVT